MPRLFHICIALGLIASACDPISTPDQEDCTVEPEALFTTTHQLDFEVDLSQDSTSVLSFSLRNDACRSVRFNYLTDVEGEDAQAFFVHPPAQGYEPWIKTRDAVEVTVEFSPPEPGEYTDAQIQIAYSYTVSENQMEQGEMEVLKLRGVAYYPDSTKD